MVSHSWKKVESRSLKTDHYCQHWVRLAITIGELKSVLDWCETSLNNRYKFMEDHEYDHDSVGQYYDWVFMFDSEEDMLMFVLTWK